MKIDENRAVTYSSLTAWLYALSLAGYPITALIVNSLGLESRPISAAFRAGFLGLSLTSLFIAYKDGIRILKSSFWIFYLGFWALYSWRLVYDTQFSQVPLGNDPDVYLLFFAGFTLLPSFAFCRTLDMATCISALRRTLVLLLVAQVGFYASTENEIVSGLAGARLGLETLNPISFGVVGATSLALGVYVVLTDIMSRVEAKSAARFGRPLLVIAYISIVAGLVTVFLAGSRGPVLGLVAVLVLLLVRSYSTTRTKAGMVTLSILFLLLLAALVIPLTLDVGSSIIDRFDRTARGEEMSDTFRFFLWESGWQQFLESPIWGSGFEEHVLQIYPHNLPLEALMATGIFGGAIWLGMCLVAARQAALVMWRNPLYGWIPMVFVLLFGNSLFSGSLWGAGSLAHFMVAAFAVYEFRLSTEPAMRPRSTRARAIRAASSS
jgi:O-antigen ligase